MTQRTPVDTHRPGKGGDRGGRRPKLYAEPMETFKLRLPPAWIKAMQAADPAGVAHRIREAIEQLPEIANLKMRSKSKGEEHHMKLAIAGKGGVGKTTLAALLAYIYAEQGQKVIAIDADPAASLANALGLPPELAAQAHPIAEMDALIEERTGAKPGTVGGYFKLNPRVDDIPDRFSVMHRGVKLLRMGTIRGGGVGCICPESAMLKALVTHLVLYQNETLIMDMEAGLEHLGRATAGAVDAFIAMAEPGRRSLDTAHRIQQLAAEIGIKTVYLVGNKIRDDAELEFVKSSVNGLEFIGYLPFDDAAGDADRRGIAVYDAAPKLAEAARQIADKLKPPA